ncbi:MAG TPA: class I adenylate-forming enzyme family protein [Syntrophorhabdales bacterium]|nr:class I adenylate-forming enzyme family protein [Syntrophorhabdales bacterium]
MGTATRYEDIENLAVGAALERSAAMVPQKICVFFKDSALTYKQLDEESNALAASLQETGIEKGDRVAIYMFNRPEFYSTFYALQKIGAIVAWINPGYRTQELSFILNNSQAKAIFVEKGTEGFDNFGLVQELRNNLPYLSYVISLGGGNGEKVFRFEEMVSRGRKKDFRKPLIDIHRDLSMLIYTSGTTGVPKGSMITHYQVVRGGYSHVRGVRATADDIFMGILPLCHSYGCGTTLIQPVLIQASVILLETFNAEQALKAIDAQKPTLQHGAPTHYIMEMNHPNLDKYNLSSLRAGYLAGQICPEEVIQWGEDRGIYLSSSWGNSEVGPGAGTMCPFGTPLEVRKKSVGKPVPGTQVKVIDPATGKRLGTGEVGEMMVKGPNVLKGYWQNPDETDKQLEKNGWLHTGDLISVDEKGLITMYGRSKDLINRGGLKIYPAEVESLILQHPDVSQVCIVGTSNPVLGESVCACVIPRGDATISLNEIRAFLKGKVAKHKLPDELCIVSDFPRMPGGVKIRKFGAGGVQELASLDKNREKLR